MQAAGDALRELGHALRGPEPRRLEGHLPRQRPRLSLHGAAPRGRGALPAAPHALSEPAGTARSSTPRPWPAPASASPRWARGVAFADFDNDGDIDIVVAILNGAPQLFRNDQTGKNHWVMFRTVGRTSNRDGIGARIAVTTGELQQVWEIKRTVGIYSCSDPRAHFGLAQRGAHRPRAGALAEREGPGVQGRPGRSPLPDRRGERARRRADRRCGRPAWPRSVDVVVRLVRAIAGGADGDRGKGGDRRRGGCRERPRPWPSSAAMVPLVMPAPAGETTVPQFTDVTARSGIRFERINGAPDHKDYIFEAKGGGRRALRLRQRRLAGHLLHAGLDRSSGTVPATTRTARSTTTTATAPSAT